VNWELARRPARRYPATVIPISILGCFMNPYIRAVFGGLIAGLVGAGIWVAISYFSHRVVGWIA
jgi:hypothetical protein